MLYDLVVALSKFRLPAIRRVSIDRLEDNRFYIKEFFHKSLPQSLQLLNLNFEPDQRINMKYYLKDLLSCISIVSKEIYLTFFDMNQDEFSTIIRAARNSQRLVFNQCKIEKTGAIDFGEDLSYDTQLISFPYTGHSIATFGNSNRIKL